MLQDIGLSDETHSPRDGLRVLKQYFGEIKNERFFKERGLLRFRGPGDMKGGED